MRVQAMVRSHFGATDSWGDPVDVQDPPDPPDPPGYDSWGDRIPERVPGYDSWGDRIPAEEPGYDSWGDRILPRQPILNQKDFLRACLAEAGKRALVGGGLGYVAGRGAPFYTMAGALVGVYTAWEHLHREEKGKVHVTVDGETHGRSFYGNPEDVPFGGEEAEIVRRAQTQPERIAACTPAIQEPTAAQMAPWTGARTVLRQLAHERRLVADLGNLCRGEPVLNLVDAVGAAKLAATGKAVYVVQGQPAVDEQHQLTAVALNNSGSRANAQNHAYLERSVDYRLVRLHHPADLAHLDPASGVPDGMLGLPLQRNHYAEILSRDSDRQLGRIDSPELGTGGVSREDSSRFESESRVASSWTEKAGVVPTHRFKYPLFGGVLGGMAASMTAMSLTQVPGAICLSGALGFLAGRAAGRFLADHLPDSPARI